MYKVSNYIEWNFLPRSDYKLLNGKMKKKKSQFEGALLNAKGPKNSQLELDYI